MKSHRKEDINKTIIVLSDLHLGAGAVVNKQRNFLEDFHYDKELVELLNYYSSGDYENREVEIILNGDTFDLLAVPFVKCFDDEYWSESAALEKLKMIITAHWDVVSAFIDFVSVKKKKIVYVLGNHDAEMIFESLRKYFKNCFPDIVKENVEVVWKGEIEYFPLEGVLVKHGHQRDMAYYFHHEESVIEDDSGSKYFLPPWGSYYITRVLNKFKRERHFIDSVKPIKRFLINGLIYDTLFTLRFMVASAYYFFMIRFIYFFKLRFNFKKLFAYIAGELELFRDYELMIDEYIASREEVKILVLGHSHGPVLRGVADDKMFVNPGSWRKMYYLDFGKHQEDFLLTYAHLDVFDEKKEMKGNQQDKSFFCDNLRVSLNVWKGGNDLPFKQYH